MKVIQSKEVDPRVASIPGGRKGWSSHSAGWTRIWGGGYPTPEGGSHVRLFLGRGLCGQPAHPPPNDVRGLREVGGPDCPEHGANR